MNKKFVLAAACFASISLFNPAYSQIKKLKSVKNEYSRSIEKDLSKVKFDIDQVMLDPETSNLGAAWGWRGVIYTEVALLTDSNELKSQLNPTGAATLIAAESMVKFYSFSLDEQESYEAKTYADAYVPNTIFVTFDKGYDFLVKNGPYDSVKLYMDYALKLIPYDKDKLAFNNGISIETIYDCIWRAAYQDSLIDKEIEALNILKDIPTYMKSDVFVRLSQIYCDRKEYDKALEILQAGTTKIPQNSLLFLQQEINIELSRNNHQAIINKFSQAIEADPTNSGYYFSRGVTYHQLKIKETEKQDKEFREGSAVSPSKFFYRQAYKDYSKAIELDASNLDALNNLAVLIFDSANYAYKQMTRVPSQYEQYNKLAMSLYKEALEKFELLRQSGYLKGQDLIYLLEDMKKCASKTGDRAKVKEYEDMIEVEENRLNTGKG